MRRVSLPWAVVTVAVIAFIWGNSLVPGSGSGSLSLAVMDAVRSFLAGLGLPYEWVTNFLVRKTAHFSEYCLLGIVATRALDRRYTGERWRLAALAILLVLVPSIDETIQLSVAGRSGQVTDVLLDCCGAATGVVLSYVVARLWRRGRIAAQR
ncbi:VanZ family protein [Collinsella intestinalis]|uniref:VanZ family protein n=1 Tax=Collinsella intestinalis TaxID=147207 RepID=UPI001958CB03|nr:VanZ family protein [Collinsella intestinalis]